MEEAKVVRDCLSVLKAYGIMAWRHNNTGIFNKKKNKFIFHGLRGISDIIGILPNGTFLAVECKSARGRLRPEQKVFLENISRFNGLAVVARSAADLIDAIENWRNHEKPRGLP